MNEEEYRAEMAKQAKLANLIALRRLISDNMGVGHYFDKDRINLLISQEL